MGHLTYIVLVVAQTVCFVVLSESEGTLILPNLESRMREDDATTITSDDSFFSAAEVSFSFSLIHSPYHARFLSPSHTQSLSYVYHVSYVMNMCWGLCLSLFTLQLFDNLSLEVCQPLRPAALYDEAVSLVQNGKIVVVFIFYFLFFCALDWVPDGRVLGFVLFGLFHRSHCASENPS
jgi:hypothetical protein